MKRDEMHRLISEGDKQSYDGRLERLEFLFSVENRDPFPAPALAIEYYEEARLCWYVGAFVATIIMTQLTFEELLRSHYRVVKGVSGKLNCSRSINEARFYDLINEAENEGWVSHEEAKSLHMLRKNLRNPYVHVKDIKIKSDKNKKMDIKATSFVTQYLKIAVPGVVKSDTENEAKEAIQLLVTLFPKMSRYYGGL